jgi:YesN/AraC family two-component response regulator
MKNQRIGMKLTRSLTPPIALTVAVLFITVVSLFATLATRIVQLKDLSLQSATVLAEWNALDRTTNDILLSRSNIDMDGKPAWWTLENELAKHINSFENELTILAHHPSLRHVTTAIETDIGDAGYAWNYTKRNLLEAQRTLRQIARQSDLNDALTSGLLYEFYSKLLSGNLGVSETTLVLNFLNQIGILDAAGSQFSRLVGGVYEQITAEVEKNIWRIQVVGVVFLFVFAISVGTVFVLFEKARKVEQNRRELNRSKLHDLAVRLLDGGEPSRLEVKDHHTFAPDFDPTRLQRLLLIRVVNTLDFCSYTSKTDRDNRMAEVAESMIKQLRQAEFASIAATWNNEIVLLSHPIHQEPPDEEPLEELMNSLLGNAERILDWPALMVVTPLIETADLAQRYERAIQLANYYVFVGSHGVHVSSYSEGTFQKEYQYPMSLELEMQDAVVARKMEDVKRLYREIVDRASQFNYPVLRQTVLRTVLGIAVALEKLGRNNGIDLEAQITAFIDRSTVLETLSDTDTELFSLLENCFRMVEEKQSNRGSLLVEQVEQIIAAEYTDPGLCTESIAQIVHRSSAYLGRIYRSAKSESISDAINHIRLHRAAELLTTTVTPINEIAETVGMTNTSYFYTLFKKAFGTTPNDYRSNNVPTSESI